MHAFKRQHQFSCKDIKNVINSTNKGFRKSPWCTASVHVKTYSPDKFTRNMLNNLRDGTANKAHDIVTINNRFVTKVTYLIHNQQ